MFQNKANKMGTQITQRTFIPRTFELKPGLLDFPVCSESSVFPSSVDLKHQMVV